MTSILILLGLLSVATLASRRGAFEELLQSASTPLLIGIGVLLSPSVLGLLTPSALFGLEPAVDLGATSLAFFIGVRAARPSGEPIGRRAIVAGTTAVALSCAAAAAVLGAAALIAPLAWAGMSAWAAPLFAGACIAGLPAESDRTPPRVRSWARVSELSALFAALVALCAASTDPFTLLGVTLALAASTAALLLFIPARQPVARTVALLGGLAFLAGLMRLVQMPAAAAGFIAGAVVGRTALGAEASKIAQRAERPVRVVLTIVVAATVGLDWTAAALGGALAAGQAVVQVAAARVMGVHRTQLGSALASSSTPIAWVAALVGAGETSALSALLPAVLVAVAAGDLFAVFIGLAQRRAWNEERTNPGVAP
jgi:hypothetical protein